MLGARCSGGLREKRRSWKRPAPTPRGSVSVSANRGSRNQKRTPPPNDLREVDNWSPVDLRKRKKSSKRGGIQLPRSSCPRDCAAWRLVGRRSLSDPNYIVVRTHGRASARCLHGSVVPPRRATPISMVSSGLRCQQGSPPHSSATQNASSTIFGGKCWRRASRRQPLWRRKKGPRLRPPQPLSASRTAATTK